MTSKLFFIILGTIIALQSTTATKNIQTLHNNHKFATELVAVIGNEQMSENVLVSPLLVQAALTLLYYGAGGTTADFLKSSLQLQNFVSKETAMRQVAELLSSLKNKARGKAYLANALYVRERLAFDFKTDFKHMAAQYFDTPTERLHFGKTLQAAEKINYWFLAQTNYTSGEVLSPQSINEHIELLSASAISFKAMWAKAFDVKETERLNFQTDLKNYNMVDSMFVVNKFKYGELAELQAKAIELPFLKSDLNMLVLLPDKVDGLHSLEQQLKGVDLVELREQLSERKVALTLPKFKLETNIDLRTALIELGMSEIFTSAADFKNIFSSSFFSASSTCSVTRVQHKAVLTVDETGELNEMGFSFGDIFRRQTQLIVSHPFFFAIMNEDAVLLAGHVVKI